MSKSVLRVIIPAVLILALAAGGLYVLNTPSSAEAASISASGVIEADEISIAAEISGRVAEVMVDKGDSVAAGDPLFRFEDQTLQLQRQQTATAGASASADAARGAPYRPKRHSRFERPLGAGHGSGGA